MEQKPIKEILEKLRELNFKMLIEYKVGNPKTYSFEKYLSNGCKHPEVNSFCIACEEAGVHKCPKDHEFELCYMSHGAHSQDFLYAMDNPEANDSAVWSEDGVMFVLENPSKNKHKSKPDKEQYKEYEYVKGENTYKKWPATEWYWVHGQVKKQEFYEAFIGGNYGELVASAITTFKLKNAYMTNLVKCGLNKTKNEADEYKNTGDYNPECMNKCYTAFFKEEIRFVNPKVIFAFGSRTYDELSRRLKKEVREKKLSLIKLPHPARIMEDEFFRAVYLAVMAKALREKDVISDALYCRLMREYAKTDWIKKPSGKEEK